MKKLRTDKKGITWMTQEVGTIILEVLGVVLLLGLLVLFILLLIKNPDVDKAEKYADLIKGRIEQVERDSIKNLAEVQRYKQEEQILAPSGWYVVFYNKVANPRPVDCIASFPCVCICDDYDVETCDDRLTGRCSSINARTTTVIKFFSENLEEVNYLKNKNVLTLSFNTTENIDSNTNLKYLQINVKGLE